MAKRLNASIPDEAHKALRVRLAEDGTNFSDWVRERIDEYLKGKRPKKRGKEA
jgi:plasmid stability protein